LVRVPVWKSGGGLSNFAHRNMVWPVRLRLAGFNTTGFGGIDPAVPPVSAVGSKPVRLTVSIKGPLRPKADLGAASRVV